jgi:propanol-preferring alcohol dehydrogenase
VPEVGQGQILVRIEASGGCHTDLHAAEGDWPVRPTPPFIPGHEGVGTVAAVGAGVAAVKEGDRVGVPWLHTACGHCRHCHAGWETLCDLQKNTVYSVNGGFAEYVLADPNYVGHLPDGLAWETAAPILCAGVTVYKGLKETDTKPGDTVVISGIGGLGHIAVQYAKAMGLDVIAVDISDEKLALARKMGATAVINAKTSDPVAEVKALCGGAQGVLVTAVSPPAFTQALGMLAKRGTMSLVGLPPGSFELGIFETVLMRKTTRRWRFGYAPATRSPARRERSAAGSSFRPPSTIAARSISRRRAASSPTRAPPPPQSRAGTRSLPTCRRHTSCVEQHDKSEQHTKVGRARFPNLASRALKISLHSHRGVPASLVKPDLSRAHADVAMVWRLRPCRLRRNNHSWLHLVFLVALTITFPQIPLGARVRRPWLKTAINVSDYLVCRTLSVRETRTRRCEFKVE